MARLVFDRWHNAGLGAITHLEMGFVSKLAVCIVGAVLFGCATEASCIKDGPDQHSHNTDSPNERLG